MYENEYMYAIERNDDYLAHYGIRGMKWGVRKAIERGNSRALGRQYRKAQKKLAKLEKRAASGKKYAKRAALLGAGAAAAGGLAAAGTEGVSRGIAKIGGHAMNASKGIGGAMANAGRAAGNLALRIPGRGNKFKNAAIKASTGIRDAGVAMQNAGKRGSEMHKGFANVSGAVSKWGKQTNALGKSSSIMIRKGNRAIGVRNPVAGITNNTVARIGAGAIGAGLAGAAGYNAYRAATTKRAAKKAAQFRGEMQKAFKGTQYENGAPRQGKKRRRR